jgi:hypothetical protein
VAERAAGRSGTRRTTHAVWVCREAIAVLSFQEVVR